MLKHVVMYKLKENTLLNRQAVKDKLMSMRGNVDVLRSIEVGFDCLNTERSYDIVLITTFDSLEALDIYANHPFHVPIKQFMKSMYETAVSVDFII